MKIFILVLFSLLSNLHDCIKTLKQKNTENPVISIKAGSICGWGSGQDTLEITKTTIRYFQYIPKISVNPTKSKTKKITEKEWMEILDCFNPKKFAELEYNTCNVCVDGCDDWIIVQQEQSIHKISFDPGLQISQIKKLQNKLSEIKSTLLIENKKYNE